MIIYCEKCGAPYNQFFFCERCGHVMGEEESNAHNDEKKTLNPKATVTKHTTKSSEQTEMIPGAVPTTQH